MGKRKSKGFEISHWKVGEADDFRGILEQEYDDVESAMMEYNDLDQINVDTLDRPETAPFKKAKAK